MTTTPAYKRKQYLVDAGYQLRFATRLFAVIFAVALISALTSCWLVWINLYTPDHASHTAIVTAFVAVAATLFIELLLAIPFVFILGVRQTQRVIGPIARMKRALDAIGQGDFSQRVDLRHGDPLEELARSMNKMAQKLERRSSR